MRRTALVVAIFTVAAAILAVAVSSGAAATHRASAVRVAQACPLQTYMTVCATVYYVGTDAGGPIYYPVASGQPKTGYTWDGISGDAHEIIAGQSNPEGSCYSSGTS